MGKEERAGQSFVKKYTVYLADSSGDIIRQEICRGMESVSTLMLSTSWSAATVVRGASHTLITHLRECTTLA